MIHNDVQNQLQFLIKTSAPPLIAVTDDATSSPQLTPGQRIPAHVLASLPNGRFEVRVGDQVLDLNLPRNTQAGDTLELTFIGDKPRLTFALSQDLANLAPARTPVALSETAKFIGTLLQKSGESAAQAAQLAKTAPVVTTMPASAADFAQALRQAVSQSGLFYESHQAQWVGGERPLAALLAEPQGQLSPLLNRASSQAAGQLGMAAEESAALPGQTNRPGTEPVHQQATHLVQQQLHALDSRQVIWQGQVWPGQDMFWEIDEDGERRAGEEEHETAGWQTRLNLDLPAMGGISARIAFVEGAIKLSLSAEENASAALMQARQSRLAGAFADAGLPLDAFTVKHEPAQE